MKKYDLTMRDASLYLDRSQKTVWRYIKAGKLPARLTRSVRGTKEYRFNIDDVNALRDELESARVAQELKNVKWIKQ